MFSTPAPFEEVFPTIDEITVTVKEEGYMVKRKSSWSMTKDNLRSDFPCGNIMCKKNSGINIQSLIREMVHENLTEKKGGFPCKGNEQRRKCMNSYYLEITIKYKETASS